MVSFMFSYPNLTPLSAATVRMVAQKVASLSFDRIYGAFWERVIPAHGSEIVRRSVARYLAAIDPSGRAPTIGQL